MAFDGFELTLQENLHLVLITLVPAIHRQVHVTRFAVPSLNAHCTVWKPDDLRQATWNKMNLVAFTINEDDHPAHLIDAPEWWAMISSILKIVGVDDWRSAAEKRAIGHNAIHPDIIVASGSPCSDSTTRVRVWTSLIAANFWVIAKMAMALGNHFIGELPASQCVTSSCAHRETQFAWNGHVWIAHWAPCPEKRSVNWLSILLAPRSRNLSSLRLIDEIYTQLVIS